MANSKISEKEKIDFLKILEIRFEKNSNRHPNTKWNDIFKIIVDDEKVLKIIMEMEATGGEPDVVELENYKNKLVFVDCSPETPKQRVSLCYDKKAWEERKKFKPESNVMDEANKMNVELLTEVDYINLQKFGPFDQKTSSWLSTPTEVRKLGGAIFGDYRFGRTFIYHNGAESYYASRGYRTKLIL